MSAIPPISLKCPGCGKRGIAIDPEAAATITCPRCACDLQDLAHIATVAGTRLLQAEVALRSGEFDDAAELAVASWNLRHSGRSAVICYLASAAAGQFEAAALWNAARDTSGGPPGKS